MIVRFYDTVEEEKVKFVVVMTRFQKQWIFVKHKQRTTFEIPGGHREINESIENAAKRELYEETGIQDMTLYPVCTYSVKGINRVNHVGKESFGALFYAEVDNIGELPESEIESVHMFNHIPEHVTYPQIQPKLYAYVMKWLIIHELYDMSIMK